MKNWYDKFVGKQKVASGLGPDGDLSRVSHEPEGMDAFLTTTPDLDLQDLSALYTDRRAAAARPGETLRVASVDNLKGFTRIASTTLVRHAERDLWSIKEGEDGEFMIERLFDDDGNPVKV